MSEPTIPDEAVTAYNYGEDGCRGVEGGRHDSDMTCCVRAGLAAAYPLLRRQWEAEQAEKISDAYDAGWAAAHSKANDDE